MWRIVGVVLAIPVAILIFVIVAASIAAAFGSKRKTPPQEWAEELERHLLGTEGPYDWDDTTSVTFADPRLERLRSTLIPDFDLLDAPEKTEEFRRIIDALRRGDIPARS
jgi:hypothetical protein